LRDRLLVADVREDLRDDRHAAARSGRDLESRGRHHREQTDGLEGHRLAAGVGTSDDEDRDLAAESDVDSNDAPLLHEERVPRVDEVDDPLGVQRGPCGLERIRVEGLREREVERGERSRDRVEVVGRAFDAAR
jgi:hypothetical protein